MDAITSVMSISIFAGTVLNVLNLGSSKKFPFGLVSNKRSPLLPLSLSTILALKGAGIAYFSSFYFDYYYYINVPNLAVDLGPYSLGFFACPFICKAEVVQ